MKKTYKILLVDTSNDNFSKEIDFNLEISGNDIDNAFDYLWGEGNLSDDCNRVGYLYDEYDENKYDCTEYILAKAWDLDGNVIFDETVVGVVDNDGPNRQICMD